MAITKLMGEIYQAHKDGIPIDILAARYSISQGSVNKKIRKVEQALHPPIKPGSTPLAKNSTSKTRWDIESIKKGMDKFFADNGRMPTARDFDESTYLPSARQIQRGYGGLIKLREALGYEEIDYTKGQLRTTIAITANKRGLTAEDYLEPLLIEKFGEPYVHVQKRYYKGSKCRYDFLVYAKDHVFGIDVFTTDRASYIEKNIRHKISRYRNAPESLKIYFVLIGEGYSAYDVLAARMSVRELEKFPNMLPLHMSEFIELISTYEPLELPEGLVGLELLESTSRA